MTYLFVVIYFMYLQLQKKILKIFCHPINFMVIDKIRNQLPSVYKNQDKKKARNCFAVFSFDC